MKARHWIPLVLFGVLVAFLAVGLNRDPRELPSPLVGKAAPRFDLPQLLQPQERFSPASLKGQVWVLNVWASWCTGCREEHPLLAEFARKPGVLLVGLDYKDPRPDALKFLARNGDPYRMTVADADGRVGIDWGVYGVPETFVIDRAGVIRHKHVGPLTAEALQQTILPLIERLNRT